jgi:hypothetical protein
MRGAHEEAVHHAHVALGHALPARHYAEDAVKSHLEHHRTKQRTSVGAGVPAENKRSRTGRRSERSSVRLET